MAFANRMGFCVLVVADTVAQICFVTIYAVNALVVLVGLTCRADHYIVRLYDGFELFVTIPLGNIK